MKFLVIEDEESLRRSVIKYLTDEGNVCDWSSSFREADEKMMLYDYDCIILDLGLPDGEGLKLLQQLRKSNKTDGVLIVSARNALDQKLEGLRLGADDYLTKPFHLSELYARAQAIIRRKSFQGNDTVRFGEIEVDTVAKTVHVSGRELYLTRKEFDLLLYFIVNKNKVVPKSAAITHIWGDEADMADSFDFIYTHIKNLRKKLSDAGSRDYFHSVYGVGYKFTDG
ncbi:response regulator transcription factor [Pedobacter sp. JY14-1]|uniref:response regulator transcription factor n=1 Tax=Pedobacter sp. JY14-1 TaxID=3034151 RepID=UPI0023E09103|nr:response regulator transcription factor [Pedobacter sp. JY14-1]